MKYKFTLLASAIIFFIGCSKKDASPSSGQTPQMISVISTQTISTDGNSYDTFSFPKPDLTKGTLESVNIKLVVSVNYTFTLENDMDSAFNYDIKLGREDFINSSALSSDLQDSIVKDYYYTLAASNGVAGSGPDFIAINSLPLLQQYTAIDTTLAPSSFSEGNNIQLNHQSITFGYSQNGVWYTLRGSANDSLVLSLQYNYIPNTTK
jgi:hypothetical protein